MDLGSSLSSSRSHESDLKTTGNIGGGECVSARGKARCKVAEDSLFEVFEEQIQLDVITVGQRE